MPARYILWFAEVDKEDVDIVGGKGANLGEMTRAGFPVPSGFIVTVEAYRDFLTNHRLEEKIREGLEGLEVGNSEQLEAKAKKVQRLITRSEFPKAIAQEIIRAYFKLDDNLFQHPYVAVRSSATAEDLPSASFAGQQATFLNVSGEANLIEKVKEAWASLFTTRAIFYRATHKFDQLGVGIAVPVQQMVAAEKSGVLFTIEPVTNDKSKIVIEAIYGLGELIVQGSVTPDHYEVDKKELKILVKQLQTQEKMLVRKGNQNVEVAVPQSEGARQKLADREIIELAQLAKRLEHHYFFPQDAEWAIAKGKIYLVQTRPVTTLGKTVGSWQLAVGSSQQFLLRGDPASPGISCGPVKILHSPKEIRKISAGDVLVAEMTNPDYVPAMRKAVAIVTERGGRTSHAAIVSRELGIPCVVGAKAARKILKDGMVITVNGASGEIFKGSLKSSQPIHPFTHPHVTSGKLKTATKVYVNLAEPDRAKTIAKMNVDGVGLFRAEFMMAQIGTHPRKFIEDKKESLFINHMASGMTAICEAFHPRPVVYRASDFRSNEFRGLKGGEKYEPKEENPMLGYRGAARYIADPRVFELELEAIKRVRHKHGLKNLSLMIPFVRSPKELLEVKKIVRGSGLPRSPSFHLWMMVEVPTNVILIDRYLDVGIDGVSIGSNDLTMLILGTDRDNSEVAGDFNEMDAAVLWALEQTIKACSKRGVTSSICGQAPSDYPELVEKLVSWGVTSVSVNADAIDQVRETVYAAEQKL